MTFKVILKSTHIVIINVIEWCSYTYLSYISLDLLWENHALSYDAVLLIWLLWKNVSYVYFYLIYSKTACAMQCAILVTNNYWHWAKFAEFIWNITGHDCRYVYQRTCHSVYVRTRKYCMISCLYLVCMWMRELCLQCAGRQEFGDQAESLS